MKKVLVTGASGTIGLQVLRFLLSEGKYEITAFDLKSKNVYKKLKQFRKRINIVYGDINDGTIVDALVKDFDVVIHLAGILPPFANANEELVKVVDYVGTMNVCNAIKNYNPDCFLLYSSSTSVYGKQEKSDAITVTDDKNVMEEDYYSKYKLLSEDYIVNNVKNYSIFRVANVLGDPKNDALIYNGFNDKMEFIMPEDAGYAFVNAIDNEKKINKKIFNLSGGEKYIDWYSNFILQVLKNYGLSIKYLSSILFVEKNYYGGIYSDSGKLENILNFRSKNISVYYSYLQKYKVRRFIARILALPIVYFLQKKNDKLKK